MIPDLQLIFLPLAKRGLGNKNFLHFLVQFLHLRCFPAFLTLFPASDVILPLKGGGAPCTVYLHSI